MVLIETQNRTQNILRRDVFQASSLENTFTLSPTARIVFKKSGHFLLVHICGLKCCLLFTCQYNMRFPSVVSAFVSPFSEIAQMIG